MWFRSSFVATLVVGALGACQTENSSSLDEATYGSGEGAFGAAKTVMAQSCGGCHQFQALSEAQLSAQGLIVAGDAASSKLYYRIQGAASPNGPQDMPPGGTLSQGDLDKIKTWIDGL